MQEKRLCLLFPCHQTVLLHFLHNRNMRQPRCQKASQDKTLHANPLLRSVPEFRTKHEAEKTARFRWSSLYTSQKTFLHAQSAKECFVFYNITAAEQLRRLQYRRLLYLRLLHRPRHLCCGHDRHPRNAHPKQLRRAAFQHRR